MATPRPAHRVTRTFTHLSRRSTRPAKDDPVTAPTTAERRPKAVSLVSRFLRRHPPVDRPDRAELETLSAKERQELWDAYRQRPFQAITAVITSSAVILGILFTARTLDYTAGTLDYTARALGANQEAQITDRYTKAVEQLASPAVDVRLGAIYALQRLAADSPRDRPTVRNVLAAFVRNHDLCVSKPPPKPCDPEWKETVVVEPVRPPADVLAALTIAPALTTPSPLSATSAGHDRADFSKARFPHADLMDRFLGGSDLSGGNLRGAFLSGANLTGTNLSRAILSGTNLSGTDLRNADLNRTDMFRAILIGTKLNGSSLTNAHLERANLSGADLRGADLRGADLINAELRGANLTGANLRGTELTDANLTGANLMGADLRGAFGKTPAEIRAEALTDARTRFGESS
ncbi:pentapeptide repeat-containing protein [Streptosporangium sp. G12]